MQHGHLALPGSPLVTLVMARAPRPPGPRRASRRVQRARFDPPKRRPRRLHVVVRLFSREEYPKIASAPGAIHRRALRAERKGPYPRRDFAPVRHLSALAFRPRHAPPPRTLPTAYAVARPPRTHRRSRWGRKPRENIVSVRHCPAVASPTPLPPRASRLGLARTTAAATPLTSRCRPPPLPARRRQVLLPRQGAGLPLPRLV